MPSSLLVGIQPIVQYVMDTKPKRILDVGCGRGKYGVLCREYLEAVGHKIEQLDAVEIFEPYINDIHRTAYDKIYIGDVRELKLPKYDLYLMIDVIEHMPKEDGVALLERFKGGRRIVGAPRGYSPQEAVGGNEAEKHVSDWYVADFEGRAETGITNSGYFIVFIEAGK